MKRIWKTLLCALLIAVLLMMGVAAEEQAAEVALDDSTNAAETEIVIEDISDDAGIGEIELADGAISLEDEILPGDLALNDLDVAGLSMDGLAGAEGNAAAVSNESNPEDFEIDGNGVLVKYVGPGGDVVIPDGVTSIGVEAFRVCESLTSVTIPNSVTSIGYEAFSFCYNLTSVTIPDSVTYIGFSAFSCCSRLEAINVSGGNPEYTSENGILYTRDMKTLCQCPGAKTSVNIPNGVTSIGNYAFEWCEDLTSVTIPDSVTSIGLGAFAYCFSLKSVTIPYGVTSIMYGTFRDCNSLTSVTIPNSVTSIERQAFWNCGSLTNLTIPNSVTSIGEYVFRLCNSLTSITIPDSVTRIEDFAFVHCEGLTSVTIPKSVTSMGEGAFAECKKMKSAVIEKGDLKTIDQFTFAGCISLSHVTIPDNVIEIEKNIFDKGVDVVCEGVTSSIGGMLDVAIYGMPGSYAETFAKGNGLTFVRLDIPASVFVDKTKATLYAGTTLKLTVEMEPSDTETILTWTSSNEEVATVTDEGVVKALKKGTATITVKTANDKKATCEITVPQAPKKVTLNKTKATVVVGTKLALKAKLDSSKAKTTLKWTSSNPKIATVTNKGVVKTVKKGTATITVETANGKKATCRITVPAAPTKIAFARKAYTVKVGKKVKLSVKLTPAKAKTKLTFSSGNEKIATVTSTGVVKGIKKGTATITVKTANGLKKKVKVTVK